MVSRSYCHPYALVGWHTEPVGVDIEPFRRLPRGVLAGDRNAGRTGQRAIPTDRGPHLVVVEQEALSEALGDALDYDPRG